MAGKKIVTVGCSFGERYLSTPLAEKSREAVANAICLKIRKNLFYPISYSLLAIKTVP